MGAGGAQSIEFRDVVADDAAGIEDEAIRPAQHKVLSFRKARII